MFDPGALPSRTIAVISIALLIVLIAVGGVAIAAVIDATSPEATSPAAGPAEEAMNGSPGVSERKPPETAARPNLFLDQPDSTRASGGFEALSEEPLGDTEAASSDLAQSNRQIRRLFGEACAGFERGRAEVHASMIPQLAEIIALVNQQDAMEYRFVVVEADSDLAARRADALEEMLRLNVIHPSRIAVVGEAGPQGVRLDVSP